jgi:hypothetical protein
LAKRLSRPAIMPALSSPTLMVVLIVLMPLTLPARARFDNSVPPPLQSSTTP